MQSVYHLQLSSNHCLRLCQVTSLSLPLLFSRFRDFSHRCLIRPPLPPDQCKHSQRRPPFGDQCGAR